MSLTTQRLGQIRLELEEQLRRLEEQQAALQKIIISLKTPAHRKSNGTVEKLARAVARGDSESVKKQLQLGADPNQRDKAGDTPLLRAAYRKAGFRIAALLLKAGADPNLGDQYGNTPLMVCADDENLDLVRELVSHGANVNAKNKDGDTPLTNAACWGGRKVVSFLLKHGADPRLPDGAGIFAADLARQQGHGDIADLLSRKSRRS